MSEPALGSSKPTASPSRSSANKFVVGSSALSFLALGVSGYLAYIGLTESKVVGCDGGIFNCEHVLNSRWSQVFGIPVSIPAIGLYAIVIGALVSLRHGTDNPQRFAWITLSVLSTAAAVSAAWFVGLQVFSIGHFCPYCLVVHSCGVLLAAAVAWNRPRGSFSFMNSCVIGIALSGSLIAMQAFGPVPETFEIETHDPSVVPMEFDPLDDDVLFESPLGMSALSWFSLVGVVMADEAVTTDQPALGPRLVPVSGGKRQLDACKWPVWGNVDARYLIVEMFDYTCEHCRNTHQSIKAAAPLLNNDLAVLAMPVPLHRDCNDAATNSSPEGADACEIARLAISVWLVDANKFTAYHDWLFEQKRSAVEARIHADTLVDREELAAELAKGTASKYIAKNVLLYKDAGAGTVPKISFPTTTVVGEIGSAASVADLVRQQFGQ
ncbi:Thioredoxin [Neorhodopirellula lusitana]|uniref:Thioredoxin n=1 Tax=Neorhodopirellula lusitana TaxID=445327 RepID=A0ABY1QKS9_9BACT|nr:vitamin K epoxide reductase family protein [Neorhodopirellula lusitana]SMP73853.1 Thioredoxin [Neorhodopirellula lusitana]